MFTRNCLEDARNRRFFGSVSEIIELQRNPEFRLAQERDRFLQVVALFTDDPHLLALDLSLYLELRVFEQPRHLSAGFSVDPVFQHRELLGSGEVDLRILHLETGDIDAALGNSELQYFQHLLELKVGRRNHGHRRLFQLERGVRALEIETLPELADRLIDRIRQFMSIDLGYDVERGHFKSPRAAGPEWLAPRPRTGCSDRPWRVRKIPCGSCGRRPCDRRRSSWERRRNGPAWVVFSPPHPCPRCRRSMWRIRYRNAGGSVARPRRRGESRRSVRTSRRRFPPPCRDIPGTGARGMPPRHDNWDTNCRPAPRSAPCLETPDLWT